MLIAFFGGTDFGYIRVFFVDQRTKFSLQFEEVIQVDSIVHDESLVMTEGLLVAAAHIWASIVTFKFELDSNNNVT